MKDDIVFIDLSAKEGIETLLGVISLDEYYGIHIREDERGLAFTFPVGFDPIAFPVGTPVEITIPNPTPGAFSEDYWDQVISIKRRLDQAEQLPSELLERMQTPEARAAMYQAFHSTPEELGRNAVIAAQKKKDS